MGVVNRGMITKGDVDEYRYYMQQWGKSSTIVIIGKLSDLNLILPNLIHFLFSSY